MEWNKVDHPKPCACHDLFESGNLEMLGWARQVSHAVSGRWGSRRGWGWEGQKWGTGTAGAARGSLGMALHVGTSQGYSGLPCRLVASGQSDCLHGSSGLQLECSGELASLLPCSTDHPLTKGPQNQEATKCSGNLGAPPGPRDDL